MLRFLGLALISCCSVVPAQNIFTVAGAPYSHRLGIDGKPALNAPLYNPYGLLFDKITGRLVVHDGNLVVRVEPDGSLLTLVGLGESQDGSTADGTIASNLVISALRGMVQDSSGNLYVADAAQGRIFRVALDGTVTTFGGGGTNQCGAASDGGPATAAAVFSPRGLVFDSKGNLVLADAGCGIRRVSPAGIISTVYSSTSPGHYVSFEGVAIDAQDNLYVTEWFGHSALKISPAGTVTTLAGNGTAGLSGDGGPATAAQLNGPSGITLGSDGAIYIADSLNNRIRKIGVDGTISTLAGSGPIGTTTSRGFIFDPCSFTGDGGPASIATLCEPAQTLFDSAGNLLVTDFGNGRVRRIAPDGTIATIAGNGQEDRPPNSGPEIYANFDFISGAAFDPQGDLYVAESLGDQIRKITPDGNVSTFAGPGCPVPNCPNDPQAISYPGPLITDANGNVYVISGSSRIWKIAPNGTPSLVAGSGTGTGLNRAQGDGGPAVSATLNEPGAVALDGKGNIYIADTSNARIRKIDPNGIISTVAGPGQQGVDYYNAVAVDQQGRVYYSMTHANPPQPIYSVVNRLNPDGSSTLIAGNAGGCVNGPNNAEFPDDGQPATQARLCAVTSMSVDSHGTLFLSEGGYAAVLRINSDGTIQRVAGSTVATEPGDGGPATKASLGGQGWSPGPAIFDANGNMFLPQIGTSRIREVTTASYAPKASPDHIGWAGSQPQSWSIATSANFPEPFPYSVRVQTSDGGSWLSTNRVTGRIGEPITMRIDPTGLAKGFYQGTVSVITTLGAKLDVPVELLLQ